MIETTKDSSCCKALIGGAGRFRTEQMHGFLEQTDDLLDVIMIGDDGVGQRGRFSCRLAAVGWAAPAAPGR